MIRYFCDRYVIVSKSNFFLFSNWIQSEKLKKSEISMFKEKDMKIFHRCTRIKLKRHNIISKCLRKENFTIQKERKFKIQIHFSRFLSSNCIRGLTPTCKIQRRRNKRFVIPSRRIYLIQCLNSGVKFKIAVVKHWPDTCV